MSNGQIWKWSLSLTTPLSPQKCEIPPLDKPDLINLEEEPQDTSQTSEEAEKVDFEVSCPCLDRILSTLSGSVNKISVLPVSLMFSSKTEDPCQVQVPLIAAPTSSGSLDLLTLQKGCLSSIHLELLRSYSLHEHRCRGVQWLGSGPLAVSFTSEKLDASWKNIILLTDLRYGESTPFRVMGPESCAMLGIRTAPSGKYVLVLLKDAPSEVWMVSLAPFDQFLILNIQVNGLKDIKRIFHLESQFTAVEWALPEPSSPW